MASHKTIVISYCFVNIIRCVLQYISCEHHVLIARFGLVLWTKKENNLHTSTIWTPYLIFSSIDAWSLNVEEVIFSTCSNELYNKPIRKAVKYMLSLKNFQRVLELVNIKICHKHTICCNTIISLVSILFLLGSLLHF